MQRTMAAGLVALALGVVTVEARADGDRWVLAEDGTWIEQAPVPVDAPPPPAGPWSPPEAHIEDQRDRSPAADDRDDDRSERDQRDDHDDARRKDDDRPMRSGWGFGGGIALTAIGGSLLTGAALASLPVGYEGNGGGDPGSEVAAIAVLGVAATAGGIGLILWGRAPASGPRTALAVGPGDVRLTGSF